MSGEAVTGRRGSCARRGSGLREPRLRASCGVNRNLDGGVIWGTAGRAEASKPAAKMVAMAKFFMNPPASGCFVTNLANESPEERARISRCFAEEDVWML